jgi:hypothetical protein
MGARERARAEVRRDHVFRQLGFRYVVVVGARVDGEDADALAWKTAYRGAVERGEQLEVAVLP